MGRAQATHIVPLVGARRRDRLTEALGAAELTLSQRERNYRFIAAPVVWRRQGALDQSQPEPSGGYSSSGICLSSCASAITYPPVTGRPPESREP